jgi:protein AroM
MTRTIGLVTIGQAPRADLAEEYAQALPGVRIIQVGALDDLSEAEVLELAPEADDDVLVSRLRTGREVRLARRHLQPRLQVCLDRLGQDADLTVLLCTGEFPDVHPSGGVVLIPQRVLHHVVAAVVDGVPGPAGRPARLGVLIPDAAQQVSAESRWGDVGQVITAAASPYRDVDALEAAGRRLRDARVGIVVMDCIGYTRPMRQAIARITRAPAMLANAAVAMVAREVLEGIP